MIGTLVVISLRAEAGDIVMSKAAKERTWRAFMTGGTNHSAGAHTLPYIINRCEREGVGYKLIALPGQGYYIQHQDMEHLKT